MAPRLSELDADQVVRDVHDNTNEALRVNVVAGNLGAGNAVISTHLIGFASIPDNASSPFEITASLASAVTKLLVYDTTGVGLEIRTGVGTGTLLHYIGPGNDAVISLTIAAGTRVTIRSAEASAPVAGSVYVTFYT